MIPGKISSERVVNIDTSLGPEWVSTTVSRIVETTDVMNLGCRAFAIVEPTTFSSITFFPDALQEISLAANIRNFSSNPLCALLHA